MRVDFSPNKHFTPQPAAIVASVVAGLTFALFALFAPQAEQTHDDAARTASPYSSSSSAPQVQQSPQLDPALQSLEATVYHG